MSTYMIEHLKSNPAYAAGKVIKAGTKVADAGLTGKLSASGHLMHICKASESGKKIKDFNRGSNTGYVNATMQDPNDIRSKFNKEVYGTWGGDNSGYAQSDGDFYVAPKVHLGGDFKFEDGSTAIIFKSDIKIIECGSESSNPDFGNCISFEFVSSSSSTPPSSTPKEYVEAKRSGYSSYNGTFKFDIKHYNELKDLYQSVDIKDLNGDNWKATTTWTSVKKVGSSSSSSYTKVKVTRSGKSTDNGTFYFPLSAWEDIKDLKLAKDTKDCDGITWKATTTFNTAVRV